MDSDEDNFVKGAKKSQKRQDNIEKHDQTKCIQSFKSKFNFKKYSDIIKLKELKTTVVLGLTGEVELELLRPSIWKLSLKYFNHLASLKDWIQTANKEREAYKIKIKEFCTLKNISSDPLGGDSTEWSSFFEDNEMRKLIVKDVNRTYQEKDIFKNNGIKEMLTMILFIWAKENKKVSYWQGMNEILALVFLAIHPYYFTNKNNNKILEKIQCLDESKPTEINWEEAYLYLHDIDEIAADSYKLFSIIMSQGIRDLFDKSPIKDSKSSSLEKLCFNLTNSNLDSLDKTKDVLKMRSDAVIGVMLKEVDEQLFLYFKKIEMECFMILQRWYRCLFSREFHPSDCLKLVDAIIVSEFLDSISENKYISSHTGYFSLIEFISCAMMVYIKEDLITRDQNGCYTRLFKYPPIESINLIIHLSLELKEKYEDRRANSIQLENKSSKEKSNSIVIKPSTNNPLTNDTPSKQNSLKLDNSKMFKENSDDLHHKVEISNSSNSSNQVNLELDLKNILSKHYNVFNSEEKQSLKQIIELLSSLSLNKK